MGGGEAGLRESGLRHALIRLSGDPGPVPQPPWPLGLRLLFLVCCLGIVAGAAQMVWAVTITGGRFGTSSLQRWYWAVAWLLTVAAVVTGALGRRRAFGVICLLVAGLHVGVTSYFNHQIATLVDANPLSGHLGVWFPWDLNTTTYLWNCVAILFHAAVCFYVLRYEWPRWARRDAFAPPGFVVAASSDAGNPEGRRET